MQPLLQRIADAPREKLLWAAIGVLVTAQVIAFWMLCLHQVRKAEVRQAAAQVERVAMADCMRYIPKATLHGCNARITAQSTPAAAVPLPGGDTLDANAGASRTAMSSAMPVKIEFH